MKTSLQSVGLKSKYRMSQYEVSMYWISKDGRVLNHLGKYTDRRLKYLRIFKITTLCFKMISAHTVTYAM